MSLSLFDTTLGPFCSWYKTFYPKGLFSSEQIFFLVASLLEIWAPPKKWLNRLKNYFLEFLKTNYIFELLVTPGWMFINGVFKTYVAKKKVYVVIFWFFRICKKGHRSILLKICEVNTLWGRYLPYKFQVCPSTFIFSLYCL